MFKKNYTPKALGLLAVAATILSGFTATAQQAIRKSNLSNKNAIMVASPIFVQNNLGTAVTSKLAPKPSTGLLSPQANYLLNENFNAMTGSNLPAGWVRYNDNKTPNIALRTTNGYVTQAWGVYTLSTSTDTSFAATSWFSSPAQANRWLVTKAVTIPATGSYKLAWRSKGQDPSYRDGLKVKISTTTNAKAAFPSTNVFAVPTTGFATSLPTTAIQGESATWTTHEVDLSTYAGQTIYVAFINDSYDMFLILLDDVQIFSPSALELNIVSNVITGAVDLGTPLKQIDSLKVTTKVKNTGINPFSKVRLKTNNYTGAPLQMFNDSAVAVASGTTLTLNGGMFTPTTSGIYLIASNVTADTNNVQVATLDGMLSDTTGLIITDSTFRADVNANGTVNFGTGSTGAVGNVYTLNKADTLTTMDVLIGSASAAPTDLQIGDSLAFEVYNVDQTTFAPVGAAIYKSSPFYVTTTAAKTYTARLNAGAAPLAKGAYFFAVRQLNPRNVFYGTSTDGYQSGKSLFQVGNGGTWTDIGSTSIGSRAFLVHANMGIVKQADYAVKLDSSTYTNQAYSQIPLNQVDSLRFSLSFKNIGKMPYSNGRIAMYVNGNPVASAFKSFPALAPGASTTVSVTNGAYLPTTFGVNNIVMAVESTNPVSESKLAYTSTRLRITDTIFAQEKGPIAGSLSSTWRGLTATNIVSGNLFNIAQDDTLTSVAISTKGGTIGAICRVVIYDINAGVIGTTPLYTGNLRVHTVQDTTSNKVVYTITNADGSRGFILSAGSYIVGIKENGGTTASAPMAGIAYNDANGTANTSFFKLNTAVWRSNSAFFGNFNYFIRANFGHLPSVVTGLEATKATNGVKVYPNPATSSVNVTYDLAKDGAVSIALLNVIGQPVRNVISNLQVAGSHTAQLDLGGLPSGIYMVKATISGKTTVTKLNVQ